MKDIGLDELKKIQLDILEVIDNFCREHNIHYTLACGTMLGAVRHKGYIPWDDDIDIYLTRSDYNKLIDWFPESIDSIALISMERNNKWNRSYAQAYNNKTILKECIDNSIDRGVCIDVYPLDRVPDNDGDWLSYNKKRRMLIHLYEIKYIKLVKERTIMKNAILLIGKLLLLPFSSRFLAHLISKYAQIHNNKGYKRLFECVQGMLQKKPFSSSLMEEFEAIPFEDRKFMAMKDYDAYLKNGYGNYMQLPPEEKQVSHHLFKAYWKD